MKKPYILLLVLAILAIFGASSALAGSATVSGAMGPGSPQALVAIISTPNCTGGYGAVNVFYSVQSFTVDTDGAYNISVLSGTGNTAFYFYAGGFNPAALADGCIAASNTGNPQNVTEALTAGTTYYVVIIDDTFAQAGDTYDLTISGPGEIFIDGLEPPLPACPYPLPSGSVVRSVPAGAPTFFAPDLGSQISDLTLPAGTWYISEYEGDFALVWIACQAQPIYIPTSAIAP